LGYTGDLLAFFDLDPIHPKFIDFSKSNYTQDVYIDDKFLNEKERLEREEERKKEEEGTTRGDNQEVSAVSQTGKVFIS
jgi:hypothetical protein